MIHQLQSVSLNNWISKAHQTVNRNTTLKGEKPNAYQILITFKNENYRHTYTMNGGGFKIRVKVSGHRQYLNSGNLNQMKGVFKCRITSNNDIVSGTIKINRTISILGDKSESDMKEILRKDIIKIILKEIKKL